MVREARHWYVERFYTRCGIDPKAQRGHRKGISFLLSPIGTCCRGIYGALLDPRKTGSCREQQKRSKPEPAFPRM